MQTLLAILIIATAEFWLATILVPDGFRIFHLSLGLRYTLVCRSGHYEFITVAGDVGFERQVPFWAVIGVSVIGIALIRAIPASSPGAKGLCPTCGYDLRATPDRCPECGTETRSEAL
jgi:hypothetical protein